VVARSTPRVDDTVLIRLAGGARNSAAGGPAWYAWLKNAAPIAFTSAQGGFIARKGRGGRMGWKACRR
jgi:hypothetical protein